VDAAQLGMFLDAAADDRLYGLWHLVAHRGLRRGEACAVEWPEVDLGVGTLAVRRQLVQLGWEVVETAPKSEAGQRTVALDAGKVFTARTGRRCTRRRSTTGSTRSPPRPSCRRSGCMISAMGRRR